MMLPRVLLQAVPPPRALSFSLRPLQLGLDRSPWHVAVASQLLCRTRRLCADGVLKELLSVWPTPNALAVSSTEELEQLLTPLGLYRNRTRQLQRMSSMWETSAWEDARDLPGVGEYVADAVALFCFGCTELRSKDKALMQHAAAYGGPKLYQSVDGWTVVQNDGLFATYVDVHNACKEFRYVQGY